MKIKKSEVPRNLPLIGQFNQESFVGRGKDNIVFGLGKTATSSDAYVVKINHKLKPAEATRLAESGVARERAESGIRYKKNKYEILKHFLGDFIPTTGFVLGQEGEKNQPKRYVEMTLQQRVPEYKLSDLTMEQKANPLLRQNISGLLQRLQYMYRILGETNARVGQGAQLDAKLDLGGVSDVVRNEEFDHAFSEEEVENLIQTNKSPNLLVNPETMQLYCIDFDQGQWTPAMDHAKTVAFSIDTRTRVEHATDQARPQLIPPIMDRQSA